MSASMRAVGPAESAVRTELAALRSVAEALESLPNEEARVRVLRWAAEFFDVQLAGPKALCPPPPAVSPGWESDPDPGPTMKAACPPPVVESAIPELVAAPRVAEANRHRWEGDPDPGPALKATRLAPPPMPARWEDEPDSGLLVNAVHLPPPVPPDGEHDMEAGLAVSDLSSLFDDDPRIREPAVAAAPADRPPGVAAMLQGLAADFQKLARDWEGEGLR